jgi:rubredoxin---NAD+ reductase
MNGGLPMGRWQCTACGYIYDEASGDPYGGLPPGTPFAEIADSWLCPDCGLSQKQGFELIDLKADTRVGWGPRKTVSGELPPDRG